MQTELYVFAGNGKSVEFCVRMYKPREKRKRWQPLLAFELPETTFQTLEFAVEERTGFQVRVARRTVLRGFLW